MAEFPPWDEEAFGFPTAVVGVDANRPRVLAEELRLARRSDAKLCAATIEASDRRLAKQLTLAGFRLVEMAVDFRLNLDAAAPEASAGSGVEPLRPAHGSEIDGVIRGAFEHGRYHADPLFPRELAEARYLAWVRRSLDSDDGSVLGLVQGGSIAGVVLIGRTGEGEQRIHLGPAVRSDARGLGIGSQLVAAVVLHAAREGAQTVTSRVAATNVSATRIYHRLGFLAADARSVWHLYPFA